MPTRSSSLLGLRAIFKRTSAGLTGSHSQHVESLKERNIESRVLAFVLAGCRKQWQSLRRQFDLVVLGTVNGFAVKSFLTDPRLYRMRY